MRSSLTPALLAVALLAYVGGRVSVDAHDDAKVAPQRFVALPAAKPEQERLLDTSSGVIYTVLPGGFGGIDVISALDVREGTRRASPVHNYLAGFELDVARDSVEAAAGTVHSALVNGDVKVFSQFLGPELVAAHRGHFMWWFCGLQREMARVKRGMLHQTAGWRFEQVDGKFLLVEAPGPQ